MTLERKKASRTPKLEDLRGGSSDPKYASFRTRLDPEFERNAQKQWEDVVKDSAKLGLRPSRPNHIYVPDAQGRQHKLPVGAYLLSGGTGGGKSITAAALASAVLRNTQLDDKKKTKVTPNVAIMYAYEARGPVVPAAGVWLRALEKLLDRGLTEKAEAAAVAKAGDVGAGFNKLDDAYALSLATQTIAFFNTARAGKSSYPSLLIVDSISLPMRAFGQQEKELSKPTTSGSMVEFTRSGEPTMPGGLQPSDIAFVTRLTAIALKSNTLIVGLVNDDLVPFADRLEGMTEGMINVTAPGSFTIRERDTRTPFNLSLAQRDLDTGAAFLGYPRKSANNTLINIELD